MPIWDQNRQDIYDGAQLRFSDACHYVTKRKKAMILFWLMSTPLVCLFLMVFPICHLPPCQRVPSLSMNPHKAKGTGKKQWFQSMLQARITILFATLNYGWQCDPNVAFLHKDTTLPWAMYCPHCLLQGYPLSLLPPPDQKKGRNQGPMSYQLMYLACDLGSHEMPLQAAHGKIQLEQDLRDDLERYHFAIPRHEKCIQTNRDCSIVSDLTSQLLSLCNGILQPTLAAVLFELIRINQLLKAATVQHVFHTQQFCPCPTDFRERGRNFMRVRNLAATERLSIEVIRIASLMSWMSTMQRWSSMEQSKFQISKCLEKLAQHVWP